MFPSASSSSYLDSDQALPRRFRLGTPRVRSGCLSCKARRIKCDEGKPSCERCIKSRRQCQYPVPKVPKGPRKKTFPDTSRLLVPKTPEVQKQFFIPVLWQAPRDTRFENDLEFRYYQTFREKTVVDLAGFEDLDVWSRLVLQACDNVLSIRNAVIAIGALDQTLDAAQSRERRASFDLSATAGHVTSHHHFALEQYDKAIKRMREDATEGGQDLRTTLISCLLIVTFELFHGNHNSALKQASIGMNMIMDRMRQCKEENDDPSSRARSLFDSVDEALIQKFVRLDLSSMAFVDESLLRAHGTSQSETIEAYETMPTTFSSLSEAQKYWELSMRRIMNFMTVTSNWEYTSRIEDPPALQGLQMMANEKLVSEPPESQSFQTLRKILSATSAASDDPPKVDSATKRVSDWQNAFQPLFRLSRTASGTSDFLRATMLQIRYNATLLSTSTSPFEGELQYDKYASNFQEIIDLSRIIIGEYAQFDQQTTWSSKASFTFDVGPIGPLYIVATKCRDPVMRREAISILLAKPKRECIWDNVVAAKFATVVMNIEEQGLQGTFVPERSRIRGEGLTFNFLQRKGRLRYSSGHWCPPGHRRIKTAEVSW